MSCNGVSTDDFSQIMTDFKRTLSYFSVSKVVDPVSGDSNMTYASATNVDMVFLLEENRYLFNKEGFIEVGDAYIIAPTTVTINEYDKFTVDGRTYIVKNTFPRTVLGVAMSTYGVCFIV